MANDMPAWDQPKSANVGGVKNVLDQLKDLAKPFEDLIRPCRTPNCGHPRDQHVQLTMGYGSCKLHSCPCCFWK